MDYDSKRDKQAELLFTGKCEIKKTELDDFKNYLIKTKIAFSFTQDNQKCIFKLI